MSSCNFLYEASEALWAIDAEIITQTLCQKHCVHENIVFGNIVLLLKVYEFMQFLVPGIHCIVCN